MAFDVTPAERLAKAFSAHVALWAKERDADAASQEWLALLAFHLSMAVSAGHVCLPLGQEPDTDHWPPAGTLRGMLLGSGLAGTPEAPENCPLVLDGENRLYLHRYFAYEQNLARRVLAMMDAPAADMPAARSHLERFFGRAHSRKADWQRMAAALAMRQRLAVISGGPGTGKTTTVANILACLLSENPDTRIMLAAPTGKAAMRMLEAIRAQAARFPEALQAAMPSEAFTLHRLLGMTPRAGVFRHHAGNPLPLDTLVVDEASMIDLAMASRLFDALPSHARLILLGDKDQLSAVEAGAVFSGLSADPSLTPACAAALAEMAGVEKDAVAPPQPLSPGGLPDSAVWLTENFRFAAGSGIGRLATAIRDGRAAEAKALLENPPDGSLAWLSRRATGPLPQVVTETLRENHAACLEAITQRPHDRAAVFDAFDRFRVLCATREGPYGVTAVNTLMSAHFCRAQGISPREAWYTGRPVMVSENDYALALFNGDTGIVLPDETGTPMVYFPSGDGGFRAIPPLRLPAHETAFAMTVHKSQGSEFETLLILMPSRPGPLVTRELLYTAVTRARRQVWLAAADEVLEHGILTSVKRHSGLPARLRETGQPPR